MAEQNIHINYTLADIERYLRGDMSAKEMHEMEKTALQDPFLADAIEGYSEAPLPEAHRHLNEIAALLQQPAKEEAKVVPMPVKRFKWMRVAAMITALAGIGIVSLYLLNGNNDTAKNVNIAQEKTKEPLKADTVKAADEKTAGLIKLDSTFKPKEELNKPLAYSDNAKDKASLKKGFTSKETATLSELPSSSRNKPEDVSSLDAVATPQYDSLNSIASLAPASIDTNKRVQNVPNALQGRVAGVNVQRQYKTKGNTQWSNTNNGVSGFVNADRNKNIASLNLFNGRILDNDNLPVPNATIKLKNTQTATVTDNNGYFNFKAPDTVANITVSSIGYETTNAVVKNNAANNITVNESGQSLAETVVIGLAEKKKAKVSNDDKIVDSAAAKPEEGWDSFEEYVYKKLHKKYDSTANYAEISGDVELEFLVDKHGRPYDVKVVRSLNDDADNKAIEVLQQGPKWISDSKKKKGKVTIHF